MLATLIAFVVGAGALAACGDDPKKRLGATCDADFECASGLCAEGRCMDPEGDDDKDTLVNRIEDALGTNALLKDSDADGVLDDLEVGDVASPRDFDADGRIDAVESDKLDGDKDCIPDQRDALEAALETDMTKVADLACCCGGRCSQLGVAATAICTAGVLACSPEESDRDGDRTADACDSPALTLTASEVEAGCNEACGQIVERCDIGPPSCVAECIARASKEGMWLANYACQASNCSAAKCFDAPGFEEESRCPEACGAAKTCGVAAVAPPGQAAFSENRCRAQCAGAFHAEDAATSGIYACLAGLDLGAECRLVDALPCVLGDDICQQACGRLAFPPAENSCPQGAPVYQKWAAQGTCVSACTALGGFGEVAFNGCMALRGCSNSGDTCLANPNTAAAGCPEACAAVAETCHFADSPFSDSALCGAFCTGLTLAAPWVVPGDAGPCIRRADACDTGDEAAAVIIACVMATAIEPRCAEACNDIKVCAEELQRDPPPNCDIGCTSLVLSHPERIEPTLTCVAESNNCVEIAQGCLPPGPEDACSPACTHIIECNPTYLGGFVQCQADCRADIGQDIDRYAAWLCESLAPNCDIACGDLPNTAPESACIDLCAGQDTCSEAGYGLCPRACQAARRAFGPATSGQCLKEQLGRRCNPIAAKACDPS